jgi:hypothetical protein
MTRSSRFPVWKMMAFVAFLALPMGFCVVPVARQSEWSRLYQGMDRTIQSLQPSDPSTVNPAAWACARAATLTAYCNVCASIEQMPTAEMIRLLDDLDRKLKAKVDLDTLDWIWGRLGETGPFGEEYAESRRYMFDRCLPAKP